MKNPFNGSECTLYDFMGSKKDVFVIPNLQRNYVWEKKNVADLLTDITDGVDSKSEFFIGSMVFVEESLGINNKYLVIDGQQRIITLTLIISAIVKLRSRTTISSLNWLTRSISSP